MALQTALAAQGKNVEVTRMSPSNIYLGPDEHQAGGWYHGLAVKTGSGQISYAPGEQVGMIFPGKVTLKITALDAQSLAPYRESPPQTTWRPGTASLGSRISNWLQGKR